MTWVIIIMMLKTDAFIVPFLEFDTRNECVDYVNDPKNSDRLAIEVIDRAGFNDQIMVVACVDKPKATEVLS